MNRSVAKKPKRSKKSRSAAPKLPSRGDMVAQTLLRRVDRLTAQIAVCAAAATLACDDGAERAREAASAIPPALDGVRQELQTLHGEIEFLVSGPP
jgi:hypothetical protein